MEAMVTGEENFKGNWPLKLSPRLPPPSGSPHRLSLSGPTAEFSLWAAGCNICVLLTQAHHFSKLCLAPPARCSSAHCAPWTRSDNHHCGSLAVVSGWPLTSLWRTASRKRGIDQIKSELRAGVSSWPLGARRPDVCPCLASLIQLALHKVHELYLRSVSCGSLE